MAAARSLVMVEKQEQALIMVEVIPLSVPETCVRGTDTDGIKHSFRTCPPISTHSAKLQLLNMGRQGMFSEGWLDARATENVHHNEKRSSESSHEVESNSKVKNKTNSPQSPPQSRGLWLKSNTQSGFKCDFGLSSAKANDKSIVSVQDLSHTFDQSIISGDLIFQGKDSCKNQQHVKSKHSSSILYVTYLRSDDPLNQRGVPCYLRGYIFADSQCLQYFLMSDHRCVVTTSTIVQICPPIDVSYHRDMNSSGLVITKSTRDCLYSTLTGRQNVSQRMIHGRNPQSHLFAEGVGMGQCAENRPHYSEISCYDKQTVDSLSLRMSTMLANTVWIGTSEHALSTRKNELQELELMDQELRAFWKSSNHDNINPGDFNRTLNSLKAGERSSAVPLLLREGALLVHNSHPNSGKSTLVGAVATDILKCDAVHVISAPALFAKYGTSADAALETVLHELALRCAVKGGATECFRDNERHQQHPRQLAKVCVILDHLETFLPLSKQAGVDPYLPVLNAMTAYLNRLSFSLKTRNEFPFPSNNPLYNASHTSRSSPGFTLPLGICLVGVITCSEGSGKRRFQCAIEALGGGRFRVPLPSAMARLSAFRHAFEVCGVELTNDAMEALPEICATLTWVSGGLFLQCAKRLRSELTRRGVSRMASEQDLKRAMMHGRIQAKDDTSSYRADFPSLSRTVKEVSFSSVGGNLEAKLALEDALALSPRKQQLLFTFGLKLPTGVLLYGPPGTGKTLLARAVAQSLERDHMDIGNAGGAFLSLKASDIVRPEVGNSEKLIVSAFETARQNAPSVIFIDEFQALFGDRDGGGFILGQLSSTLLQCMDDIARWSEPPVDDELKLASAKNGRIVVLGATNAPWMIDKAFLRPGRFDRAVHVGLPDVNDSEEILRVHVSRMKLAPETDQVSPADDICKSLAELCLGYSGADLAALCRSAAVRCLSKGDGSVTKQHFIDARVHDVKRSSNDKLVKRISAWQP